MDEASGKMDEDSEPGGKPRKNPQRFAARTGMS